MRGGREGLCPWKQGLLRSGRRKLLRARAETRVIGRGCSFVVNRNCKRSIPWRMSGIQVQCRLSWPAEHFPFSRSFRSGPFGSWNGCGEQTPPTRWCDAQALRFGLEDDRCAAERCGHCSKSGSRSRNNSLLVCLARSYAMPCLRNSSRGNSPAYRSPVTWLTR